MSVRLAVTLVSLVLGGCVTEVDLGGEDEANESDAGDAAQVICPPELVMACICAATQTAGDQVCNALGTGYSRCSCLDDDPADPTDPIDPDDGDPEDPPATGGALRVFVTAARWNGDFGGVSGADAHCAESASDAGLDGTFVAFLAVGNAAPSARITANGPWFAPGSTDVAFENRAALTQPPATAFWSTTQFGDTTAAGYWTGRHQNGTFATCADWTSAVSDDKGITGSGFGGDWNGNFTINCSFEEALVCFQVE